MSLDTLQGVPASFEAGNTVLIQESFTDFPATDWTAKLNLVLGQNSPISVDSTASGNDFLFTIAWQTSASIPPGDYDYAIYVFTKTTAAQRATAKTGVLTVLPDLTQVLAPSKAQEMVTLLEAVLQTFATTANQSVSFNGQSYSRGNIMEYQRQIVYWQSRVIAEQDKLNAQRGAGNPSVIYTRFTPMDGGNFQFTGPWNGDRQ